MKSFEKDEIIYTCHGQTPDLYEELFGDDSDLLSDAVTVSKDIANLARSNKGMDFADFKDIEKMSENEMLNIVQKAENINTKLPSRSKMRQIIICCIAQSLKDSGQPYTVDGIMKNLDAGIFIDYMLFAEIASLIFGKKKENAMANRSNLIYR